MQMLIGYPESLLDSGQQNKIYYDVRNPIYELVY